MVNPLSPTLQDLPLNIVGSTTFGRYPKISIENTFNMIISDGWLVPSAGYEVKSGIVSSGENVGRGLYTSNRNNTMFAVVDNGIYIINSTLNAEQIGQINTFEGDVFIAENDGDQIAFCDQSSLYIYNYSTNIFSIATLPTGVTPGYVTFQDGYFIIPDLNSSAWYLSAPNDGTSWNWGPGSPGTPVNGTIATKPDKAIAAVRFPGQGNLLIVFGKTVAELWTDVGAQGFPYQRNTAINIDFGCVSSATIAEQENIVVWLAQNEKSGPVIAFTSGGQINRISNDGIDFRLSHLNFPDRSSAFLFKQDGHLLYQITFYDPTDNLTLQYDFTTQKFFTLTDEAMNFHIAKRVSYYNNKYYFVSINDGFLYEMSSLITTYNGKEIPRVRTCKNIRLPNSSTFVVQNLTFTMEMGADSAYLYPKTPPFLETEDGLTLTAENDKAFILWNNVYSIPNAPRVDLSLSKNGGENFSSYGFKNVFPQGVRKNRLRFFNLGLANDFVPQIRFYGMGRFVATDGLVSIYQ